MSATLHPEPQLMVALKQMERKTGHMVWTRDVAYFLVDTPQKCRRLEAQQFEARVLAGTSPTRLRIEAVTCIQPCEASLNGTPLLNPHGHIIIEEW